MHSIRPYALLLLLIVALPSHAQFTDVISSNRPGESMSAFSVGQTVFQVEGGFYGFKEKHDVLGYEDAGFGVETSLRYGAFFEQLELILDLKYQKDRFESPMGNLDRNGMKQMTFGAKYLIYDPNKNYEKKPNLYSWKANHSFSWREFIPAVGAYAGFNLHLDDTYTYPNEESFSPKFMVLTQNQFGRWVFVTNLIADRIMTSYMSLEYILTLTRGFNERWSGFVENQGIKSDVYSDGIFRLGAAYLIKENIQVDASLTKNIKETPSLLGAGIGLSWRFDENYQEVILRAPKDEKKDTKTKEEKKKEKAAKKRKDAVEGTEAP